MVISGGSSTLNLSNSIVAMNGTTGQVVVSENSNPSDTTVSVKYDISFGMVFSSSSLASETTVISGYSTFPGFPDLPYIPFWNRFLLQPVLVGIRLRKLEGKFFLQYVLPRYNRFFSGIVSVHCRIRFVRRRLPLLLGLLNGDVVRGCHDT